jgi:WD40 repeat protein
MGEEPHAQEKLKVFISYSRADATLADELVDALEYYGAFNVTIDRHSIVEGEDWKKRLGALIADADTVVFVLSPDSATSDICNWEVECAAALSKRIIPVLGAQLGSHPAPEKLAALNYVRFDEGRSFMAGVKALVRALETDLEWLREHTRLLVRAMEWDHAGRVENRMLSGGDIAEAKAWAAKRPKGAPEPTGLHLDYIRASEDAESARMSAERKRLADMEAAQDARAKALAEAEAALEREAEAQAARARARRVIAWGAAAVVALLLTGAGLFTYQQYAAAELARRNEATQRELTAIAEREQARATEQEKAALAAKERAEAEARRAEAEKKHAEIEKQRADDELENAQIAQSRFLLDRAREQLDKSPEVSLLLMLEALPDETVPSRRNWPVIDGAQVVLDSAWRSMANSRDIVGHAVFSPDGERLVTASGDRIAHVWDVATGREITALEGHEGYLKSASFSPDGEQVVTASGDNSARVWDAVGGKQIAVLKGHEGPVASAAFSPDGERVVTASSDKTARLWEAATGREIAALKGHEGRVLSADFSADGKRILTIGYEDSTPRLWHGVTGEEIAALREHEGALGGATFSPDGQRIVTFGDDAARLWEAARGWQIAILEAGPVHIAAFSPDGQRVVTGEQLWDAKTGREIAVLKGHTHPVWSATFGPDGERVVTASWGKKARLWEAATGREIAALEGHEGSVFSAAFSPDGQRIVTASKDKTARVWETATGREILVLGGHKGEVVSAEFSPDGQWILTAFRDRDETIERLWRVGPSLKLQDLVNRSKTDVGRCLTEGERKRFFLSKEAPDWCHEMSKWPYKPLRWGVSYATPTDKQSKRLGIFGAKGLVVTHVSPGLPGEVAGFELGDLIMRIGAQPAHTVEGANKLLDSAPAGSAVPVTVRRGEEIKVLTITPRF